MRNILIVTTSLLVAACSSVSTDPNKGGFIGGLKGIVGGEYDKRLTQKQSEVDELSALNDTLARRLDRTNNERSIVDVEIGKLSERLKKSKVSLDASRRLLESEEATKLSETEVLADIKFEQQRLETLMLDLTLITAQLEKDELKAIEEKEVSISPSILRNDALDKNIKLAKLKEEKISQDVSKHLSIIDKLFNNLNNAGH
ncbi:hypothetical protein [Photobacterium kasasachensis]|uniref:hypothetical protein n=1 Tax=Photobacterium kasasachensis TaxID=2910240 RepID=UPI003D0E4B49